MSSCARTTHSPEVLMLIQEKISGSDTLLKLYTWPPRQLVRTVRTRIRAKQADFIYDLFT
jgi:hypothetical protein